MVGVHKISLIAGLAFAIAASPGNAFGAAFSVLHSFTNQGDGEFPEGGLIMDSAGNLYGTTFGALEGNVPGKHCPKTCGTAFGFTSDGSTQVSSYDFTGDGGAFPTGELLKQGKYFYGTTEFGPATACGGLGCGTAYQLRIRKNGHVVEKKLFKFCRDTNCSDGAFPHGTLIADKSQNLYGITTAGGSGNGWLCGSSFGGCGVIYKIPSTGDRTVIYSFCSMPNCADGAVPLGSLLLDKNANIYGTTQFGGANTAGTIFRLAPDGTYTVLYNFCTTPSCADGAVSQAALFQDKDGNLFGTTKYGGDPTCADGLGCGVAFKFAPPYGPSDYTILHRFTGGDTDGQFPQSPLVADAAGNLYGTTLRGGGQTCTGGGTTGCGTVFVIVPDTSTSILHSFGGTDGTHPAGALLLKDGILYGAAREKGDPVCTCGTLYTIDLNAR